MRLSRYLILLFFLLPMISPLLLAEEASEVSEVSEEKWTPRDEDLRVLRVQVEKYKLKDALRAYQRKDYLLIPLGYLARILDFAIDVDIGPGVANGFVFNESSTFYLDTSRNEVTVKGVSSNYDTNLVYVLNDDIYVDSSLLSKWFTLSINANLFASTVTIKSEQAFPLVQRMQRQEKIAKTREHLKVDTAYYPYHYEPYDTLNMPFIDQTFDTTTRKNDIGSTNALRSTTYMTSDVVGMEASMFLLATNDDVLDDFRFTLGKKDPDSELLGHFQASEYSMGHITEPRLKNITIPGEQEPGALLSNFPLNQQAEYDRHRFRGNLLPGWEVELYHNDRLIGYQSTAIDGQYDFDDIPILFGRNYFRLVFYGPQGQVREQEQTFELGQALTKKGKHYYRVLASDNEEGGSRATAQYDIGLSNRVSASVVAASIPLNSTSSTTEQHNYVQAGLRAYWESVFATVDYISDIDGGEAINFDLQTGIGSTVLKFNHTQLNNFFSEEYQLTAQEFKSTTQFRLDSTIPPSFLPRIPYSLELVMSDFVSGNDKNELINVLSLQTYGLSLSNQLNYVQNSAQQNQFTGVFGLSSNINNYGLRGTVNYAFQPIDEITTVDLTLRPPLFSDFQFTYGLNHSLINNLTEFSASASKAIGKYNLSLGARYNTDEVASLDARFSIGIGREPRSRRWQTDALAVAGRGSVSARVYLDNNQDGIYNKGDEPIENVGFNVNGGYQQVHTDKNGIAFITGIPEHRVVNLSIKESTLADPQWTAALDGVRIVPRPGQAMQLDFPVFTSGEIDGTVHLFTDSGTLPAGRVQVEIVNQDDRVIASTTTEYDGFYVIGNIPLGSYSVRIAETQLASLNLRTDSDPYVVVSAKEKFVTGVDFTLLKKP